MRTAADYKDWFYRHMPRGPVWPVDAQTTPVWDSLLGALSLEPARIDAYLISILRAFIPATDMSWEMFDVWEAILGLTPQSDDSDAERRTAILALLGQYISPNLDAIQAYADLFGVNAVVTHQEHQLPYSGVLVSGGALYGVQFAYVWTVTYDGPQSDTFEAAMRAVAPQHTTLLFVVTP